MKNPHKILFYTFTVFYSFFASLSAKAQSPGYQWAHSAGGNDNEGARSVAADLNNNVFVTGPFKADTLFFGSTALVNNQAGFADFYLVKYDAAGNVLWATSGGGYSDEGTYGVSTDANGDVFVAGLSFSPTITIGTTTLNNPQQYSMFIVKYGVSGNLIWANLAGGESDLNGVAADLSGNVYVAGYYGDSTITFGSTTLINQGLIDNYLVKYDTNGNVIWAVSAGGSGFDYSIGVATDDQKNVCVSGLFYSDTLTFGTISLINANPGTSDIYVVKYDSSGTILWAKSAGGTANDASYSIATDGDGNMYATGYYSSMTLNFGNNVLNNSGGADVYIVKYNASGTDLWAKSSVGNGNGQGNSIITDLYGSAYITGHFTDSITFGSVVFNNAGDADVFIIKYDTTGTVSWGKSAGGTSFDYSYAICGDGNGDIYFAGDFKSPALAFGTIVLSNAGNSDIFLAKLNSTTGIAENNTNDAVTIFPNPSNGKFRITNTEAGQWKIKIYDLPGNTIYQSLISNENNEVNLTYPSKGIYFYELLNNTGQLKTGKIIIQ